jgi:hypothetical protein
MVAMEFRQTTDDVVLEEVLAWRYEEPPIEADDPPRFFFTLPNASGLNAHRVHPGKAIRIKRLGEIAFQGLVDTTVPTKGHELTRMDVEGISKGYHYLRRNVCTSYDYEETGAPVRTRGGVTINPWSPFIFRQDASTLDIYGNLNPLDGVTFDEMARAIIGTRLVVQHDFRDDSFLKPSTMTDASVYLDGQGGHIREALALNRDGTTYEQTGSVESIELMNGDPNLRVMGIISAVDVLLIGKSVAPDAAGDGITLKVCRNAGEGTRTYSTVTLTMDTDYLGSGLQAWTGTHTFSGSETQKNRLAYKVEFTSPTTQIDDGIHIITREGKAAAAVTTNGTTFSDAGTVTAATGDNQAVRIVDEKTRLMAVAGKVFKSTNRGENWAQVLGKPTAFTVLLQRASVDFASSTTFWAAQVDEAGGNYSLYVSKTTDGGLSWGTPVLIATFGSVFTSFHLAAFDANNLVVLYSVNAGQTFMQKSDDAGATWGTAHVVVGTPAYSQNHLQQGVLAETANKFHTMHLVNTTGTAYVARYRRLTSVGTTLSSASTDIESVSITDASAIDFGAAIVQSPADVNNLYVAYVLSATGTPKLQFSKATDNGSPGNWITPQTIATGATADDSIFITGMGALSDDEVLITYYLVTATTAYLKVARTTNATAGTPTWTHHDIDDYPIATTRFYAFDILTQSIEVFDHLHYLKAIATTASDVDLTEGTIDAYDNPAIDGLRNGEEDWIEKDFLGMYRIEALEELRRSTESDVGNNEFPHWDAWVDHNLAFHFVERRGSDIDITYSFANENLYSLRKKFYGAEIGYQTEAFGAGSGIAQNRIVSKEDFATGGLYTPALDPTAGGTSPYAPIARILKFIDPNETDPVALLRKARAHHKLHLTPIETLEAGLRAETIRYFSTGDSVNIDDIQCRTTGPIRISRLARSGRGHSLESIDVDIGKSPPTIYSRQRGERLNKDALTIRGPLSGMVAASGATDVRFDKDNYGHYKFTPPPNRPISRFILRVTTIPYVTAGTTAVTTFKGNTAGPQAVYCEGIQFGVDVSRDSADIPFDFAADRFPQVFGESFSSVTHLFDLTNYMDADSNGAIDQLDHIFHFLGAASPNNTQGLAAVSVTPFVRYATGD